MKGDCSQKTRARLQALVRHIVGLNEFLIRSCLPPSSFWNLANYMEKLRLVTTKAIAEEYGRSTGVIMHWAREGIIPSLRLGCRTRLYAPEQVRAALVHVWVRKADRLLQLWWLTGDLRSLVAAVIPSDRDAVANIRRRFDKQHRRLLAHSEPATARVRNWM